MTALGAFRTYTHDVAGLFGMLTSGWVTVEGSYGLQHVSQAPATGGNTIGTKRTCWIGWWCLIATAAMGKLTLDTAGWVATLLDPYASNRVGIL